MAVSTFTVTPVGQRYTGDISMGGLLETIRRAGGTCSADEIARALQDGPAASAVARELIARRLAPMLGTAVAEGLLTHNVPGPGAPADRGAAHLGAARAPAPPGWHEAPRRAPEPAARRAAGAAS